MAVNINTNIELPLKWKLESFFKFRAELQRYGRYLDRLTEGQVASNIYYLNHIRKMKARGCDMAAYIRLIRENDWFKRLVFHLWASFWHGFVKKGAVREEYGVEVTCHRRCIQCLIENMGNAN